jgi:hypothetical protein
MKFGRHRLGNTDEGEASILLPKGLLPAAVLADHRTWQSRGTKMKFSLVKPILMAPSTNALISFWSLQHTTEGVPMDLHATNSASRAIGTPVASPQAAASRAPRRLAYEAHFSRDRPHRLHDWSDDAAPDVAMEITPSEAAIRHRLSWHGMGVETARFAERGNIESRSRAAAHLLVLFEEGARKDGYTLVEGLTRISHHNRCIGAANR